MSQVVMAIYEQGLLRPLKPLNIPDQQMVCIQVLTETAIQGVDQAIQLLVKAGLLTLPSNQTESDPVSVEERRRVADNLGQAASKPLSQIVIEDRGEW